MENNQQLQDVLKQLEAQQQITNSLAEVVKKMLDEKNINSKLNDAIAQSTDLTIQHLPSSPSFVNFNAKPAYKKFMGMVATSLQKISPHFAFKEENNTNWENMGFRIGFKVKQIKDAGNQKISVLFQKNKMSFKETSKSMKVYLKQYQSLASENIKDAFDYFVLVGDQRKIKKLNSQFKNNLEFLGFKPEDLISRDVSVHTDNVQEKIDSYLSKKLNLTASVEGYTSNILNDLTDPLKFEMIQKIVWPNLAKELSKAMNLSIYLSEIVNKDKDVKFLIDFSKKNQIHSDIVVHSLKKNPEILENSFGFKTLMENRENILKASDKYQTVIQNNLVVINSLIHATTCIKRILFSLDDSTQAKNFIETIDNYEITKTNSFGKEKSSYIYSAIEKNIASIRNEKPVASKNTSLAL